MIVLSFFPFFSLYLHCTFFFTYTGICLLLSFIQPIDSVIRGVNLVEKEEKGFIFSTTIQKLTFSLQLSFPRDALLRLQVGLDWWFTLDWLAMMTVFRWCLFLFFYIVLDLFKTYCSALMMISLLSAMGWKRRIPYQNTRSVIFRFVIYFCTM